MDYILDRRPDDPDQPSCRPFNIEPEAPEVYAASWVIEKARRIEARRVAQERGYFQQFSGENE